MVNFNQYLERHKIQEWKFEYLNYYLLKTYIKDRHFASFDKTLTQELAKVEKFYLSQMESLENDNLDEGYTKADMIRQYVLLNIVGFIKIIKKRNKNIIMDVTGDDGVSNDKGKDGRLGEEGVTLDATDKLSSYQFYQCRSLQEKMTVILEDAKKDNTRLLQEHFESSSSFRILVDYHRFQPSFQSYTDLPFCSQEFVQKYLSQKLDVDTGVGVGLDRGRDEGGVGVGGVGKGGDEDGGNKKGTVITQVLEIEQRQAEDTVLDIPVTEIPALVRYQRYGMLLVSLYGFLFGLGLMGDSFKAMNGKTMGTFFSAVSNPIAGVMIGIIVTVLLQSSSTTTSIVVSMVGADLINVKNAIPVIMGANIGTSVTNTIVSQGHIRNVEEFKRAFAGATVHDLFNLLSVMILLPFNLITDAFGYPFFEKFTNEVTSVFADVEAGTFKSPIKIIVSPLTKLFLKVDKDVIKAHAKGCVACEPNATLTGESGEADYCLDIEGETCISHTDWETTLNDSDVIKSGWFRELGSVFSLFFSLGVLCLSIYFLIKTLQKVVIGGGRQNWVIRTLQKIMNRSPYLSMLFGIGLTIMVQSSSITTSTFTPLVGLDIISLEQMLPLTLGANIGTTCTAFLAALVSGKVNAIQIALCHFFFNIFGILIWFPSRSMRNIPLTGAKALGEYITKYKWFGFFYLCYVFMLVPLLLLATSLLFDVGHILATLFGVVCIATIILGSVGLFYNFDHALHRFERCLRP